MSALLDALGYIGGSLDKPGRAVRGLLGGHPEELGNLIPFSDAMGITDPQNAVSGRRLLEHLGAVNPKQEGDESFDGGDLAGMAAGVATDPLMYVGGGLMGMLGKKALGRGTVAAGEAARPLAQAAEAAKPVSLMDALGQAPIKASGTLPNLEDFIPNAPPFYSRLERAIQGLPDNPKTQSVMNMVKKAGVSDEELQYSKLEDALAGERTPKQSLLDQFNKNRIDVQPALGPGKYSDYSLPGGKNYEEHLLKLGGDTEGYHSPHFQDPNVLAHLRTQEFATPEGNPFLHADEIQSDWHQAGAKQGYRQPHNPETWEAARQRAIEADAAEKSILRANMERRAQLGKELGVDPYSDTIHSHPDIQAIAGQYHAAKKAVDEAHHEFWRLSPENTKGVPDAPFKEAWPELAMKHLLRTAAERNMERVSWNPGNVIQEIVGGQLGGQQKFYDETLPNIAAKLGKPYGVAPEHIKLPTQYLGNQTNFSPITQQAMKEMAQRQGTMVHSLALTPEMREAIMKKGFPLLSLGGGSALLSQLLGDQS